MNNDDEIIELKRQRNYWYRQYNEIRIMRDALEIRLREAEGTIRTELEPRIKREKKAYDIQASIGFDPCSINGQSGRCGEECELFDTADCHGDFTQ